MSGPRRVVVRAPGKVNPALAVGGVDERGYHELATVFQAVDLEETVTAERAGSLTLTVDSDVPGEIPLDGRNLVLQAAELLRRHTGTDAGAALHVHKRVPVAGGMGGGSADAAAALVALDRLWCLDLPTPELHRLGARLGADVPFALLGGTALGRGTGADLTPLDAPGPWTWVLAVPGGHLSTPAVFRDHDARSAGAVTAAPAVPDALVAALAAGDTRALGARLVNDLQVAACALHPGLRPVLDAARRLGAPGAIVSGSGPTLAVLAEDEDQGHRLAAALLAEGLALDGRVVRGGAPGARVVAED